MSPINKVHISIFLSMTYISVASKPTDLHGRYIIYFQLYLNFQPSQKSICTTILLYYYTTNYIDIVGMIEQSTMNVAKSCGESFDSQSQRCPSKDTSYSLNPKEVFQQVFNYTNKFLKHVQLSSGILIKICGNTAMSDKIIRLVGSVMKLLKNFQLLQNAKLFDKFLPQIGQLRRLLRVNRITFITKDLILFCKKQQKKKRDYFDLIFKFVMLFCDINDMLLYLMQLHVLKQRATATLRKNILNFYFFQCMIWTFQHIYDYCTKQHKTKGEARTREANILKYMMDALVSHNDFSGKFFTINVKNSTIIGLISSIIGLILVWK